MGITPHTPTQNRTCAINAYGFSLYAIKCTSLFSTVISGFLDTMDVSDFLYPFEFLSYFFDSVSIPLERK